MRKTLIEFYSKGTFYFRYKINIIPESGMVVRSRDELNCKVLLTSDHQYIRSPVDRVSLCYKKGEWTGL